MDKISFEKPHDFVPEFSAKLVKKKATWGFYLGILIMMACLPQAFAEGAYFEASCIILSLLLFVYGILHFYKLNRNGVILELSQDGIWLPLNKFFIPTQRIYHAFPASRMRRTPYTSANINDIGIMIKLTRREYEAINRGSFFIKRIDIGDFIEEISSDLLQVIVHVPFTVGKTDDIGLNILKMELIQKINATIGDATYSLATDNSQYRGYI